jgi:hypothetical protein
MTVVTTFPAPTSSARVALEILRWRVAGSLWQDDGGAL